MSISDVTNVSRSRGSVAVTLDEPTDEVVDQVRDLHGELDYAIWNVEDGADRTKVRGRGVDSDEPAPEPRHLDDDLVSIVERKPHVCQSCGRGFATGAGLGGHRRYCRMRTDR